MLKKKLFTISYKLLNYAPKIVKKWVFIAKMHTSPSGVDDFLFYESPKSLHLLGENNVRKVRNNINLSKN